MSARECHHDTTTSRIDDQTICDGCEETIRAQFEGDE